MPFLHETKSLRLPGRIEPSRLERWHAAAAAAGVTLSSYVRDAVEERIASDELAVPVPPADPIGALEQLAARARSA